AAASAGHATPTDGASRRFMAVTLERTRPRFGACMAHTRVNVELSTTISEHRCSGKTTPSPATARRTRVVGGVSGTWTAARHSAPPRLAAGRRAPFRSCVLDHVVRDHRGATRTV